MKTLKIKEIIPEVYLILATLYYWTLTSNLLNPVAITLLLILTFQLIFKKRISGLLIASVLILLNLFMILAMISELSEFTDKTQNYYNLLIFGTLFLGLNIIIGASMFWKYLIKV